jgi:hypothetical protein
MEKDKKGGELSKILKTFLMCAARELFDRSSSSFPCAGTIFMFPVFLISYHLAKNTRI